MRLIRFIGHCLDVICAFFVLGYALTLVMFGQMYDVFIGSAGLAVACWLLVRLVQKIDWN